MLTGSARGTPYAKTPPLNVPFRASFVCTVSTQAGALGGSSAATGFSIGVFDIVSAVRSEPANCEAFPCPM